MQGDWVERVCRESGQPQGAEPHWSDREGGWSTAPAVAPQGLSSPLRQLKDTCALMGSCGLPPQALPALHGPPRGRNVPGGLGSKSERLGQEVPALAPGSQHLPPRQLLTPTVPPAGKQLPPPILLTSLPPSRASVPQAEVTVATLPMPRVCPCSRTPCSLRRRGHPSCLVSVPWRMPTLAPGPLLPCDEGQPAVSPSGIPDG